MGCEPRRSPNIRASASSVPVADDPSTTGPLQPEEWKLTAQELGDTNFIHLGHIKQRRQGEDGHDVDNRPMLAACRRSEA